MDIGTIITLLVIVFSALGPVIDKQLKKAGKVNPASGKSASSGKDSASSPASSDAPAGNSHHPDEMVWQPRSASARRRPASASCRTSPTIPSQVLSERSGSGQQTIPDEASSERAASWQTLASQRTLSGQTLSGRALSHQTLVEQEGTSAIFPSTSSSSLAGTASAANAAFAMPSDSDAGSGVDRHELRKLVIYSEIMKPKF